MGRDGFNIVNILKDCHGNFNDLENITESNWDRFKTDWSYKEFSSYFKKNNLNIENVYIDNISIIYPFWYIDFNNGVYVELHNLSKDILESFKTIERIKFLINEQKKLIEDKDYILFYFHIHTKFKMLDFNKRYNTITDDIIFDVFKEIYTSVDFGFNNCDEKMIQYVFSRAPKYSNDTNEIIIYRGEGSESVSLELAHSWTTKYSTALFFAARYSYKKCKIYSAKIKKCDIIDFIDDRNESEVLCNYKDLKEITEIKAIRATDKNLYNLISLHKKDFDKYTEMIKEEWFSNIGNIHNIEHTKRVLFYCLILSKKLNLNKEDSKILIQSAMLHDIGRINDNEDDSHGQKSIDRIKKLNINPLQLTEKDLEISKQIIINHSIDDNMGIHNFKNENEIKLYKIFKDADALDRVRINDLDINYLRFEETKRYVYIATALYILKF